MTPAKPMLNMKTTGDFYSAGEYRRVEICDHVIIGGDKAHVVGIGRKNVQVLFYAGQPTVGRFNIDPLSDLIVWPGTQHA